MIVVDASVLVNAIGDDGDDGRRARAELRRAQDVAAPDLVDVETMAVLRRRWMAGRVTEERLRAGLDDLEALAVMRVPALGLLRRALELRANVSTYDATYVALAEALDCELLTADRRLARAPGLQCAIRVLA